MKNENLLIDWLRSVTINHAFFKDDKAIIGEDEKFLTIKIPKDLIANFLDVDLSYKNDIQNMNELEPYLDKMPLDIQIKWRVFMARVVSERLCA